MYYRKLVFLVLCFLLFCTNCGTQFAIVTRFCIECGAKNSRIGRTAYKSDNGAPNFVDIDEAITYYYNLRYTTQTIRCFLEKYNGFIISIRSLERKIRKLGLKKCDSAVPDDLVRQIISREIQGPSSLRGYRMMWGRLRCNYGLRVPRDQVMQFYIHTYFLKNNVYKNICLRFLKNKEYSRNTLRLQLKNTAV